MCSVDADDDFADVDAARQVFVSRPRLAETEHPIDHRMDPVHREGAVLASIGWPAGCAYQQGGAALESDAVLVAHTDGISEAVNAADEKWAKSM